MVQLVVENGLTFEAAATASNVAKSTVHLLRCSGPEVGLSIPSTAPVKAASEGAKNVCTELLDPYLLGDGSEQAYYHGVNLIGRDS